LKALETKKTANIIISFKDTNLKAVRQQVKLTTYATRGAKITDLTHRLQRHAIQIGGKVLAHLQKSRSATQRVEQLWITNEIVVRNADLALVKSLAQFGEIAEVRETKVLPAPQPLDVKPYTGPMADMQWGVADVKADLAWAQGINGSGITYATIDTGVRPGHVALVGGRRSGYSWFEPGVLTETPHDTVGHGTHVTGNIGGRENGIGVAPGSTWSACLGCRPSGCTEEDLKGCGQWALCPTEFDSTREDCAQAPRVVSNSWGGGNGDPFYDEVIAAWYEVDIVPVFAIGNSGPFCNTANSPGDGLLPIAVGSINNQRRTSSFSSRGPSVVPGVDHKPDIAAPGTDVVSSYYLSNTSYYTMSGTSMATPHAAGVIVLLLSADPTLTIDDIKEILYGNAEPHNAATGLGCAGITPGKYPNHQVGHGLLEADKLLSAVYARKAHKNVQ
jgi:subtilisin family serine protease